jgi:hypothetical protein
MASKKILLGVGLLAAMAIVVYAVAGWPPMAKNDTQGAIGVAKKYQAEQISEQDVVLADQDVQNFLQTDFFYQLVTDPDFQKLYLNGVMEKAMVQVPGSLGDHVSASLTDVGRALTDSHITQNIAAGKFDVAAGLAAQKGIKVTPEDLSKLQIKGLDAAHQVASLTELGKALSDDKVRQSMGEGKFDVAAGLAAQKGIKVTAEDLGKIDIKGLSGHQVARFDDLGKALSDDKVRQSMGEGKFDVAAGLAAQKGIKVTAEDLQKFDMNALGAKSEDLSALGRLLQKDAFHKALPYAGTMQKLMVQSGTFKNAVKSGDLSKFSQDIVGAKKKAR